MKHNDKRTRNRPVRIAVSVIIPLAWAGEVRPAAGTDVTFLVTSDSHYEAVEKLDRNERNRLTIDEMNRIAGEPWPEKLGGGPIGKPRGVVACGDLIDDGDRKGETERQWRHFVADFGLDGSDGRLKYPVYEGWGNHDGPPAGKERFGFSMQARLKARNADRRAKHLVSNVSANGLHYAWDWDGVHLVQLNIYPADRQNPKIRYNPVWHDPQGALAFLTIDLKRHVGDSGRPVVIFAHCGFDSDWWHKDDWAAFYRAVRPYNVVAYVHGHTGTKVYEWKPDDGRKPLTVINTGQTENGFFVVQITDARLRAAYRLKRAKRYRDAEGKWHYEWDGTWTWHHLLDKRLTAAALARPAPVRKRRD